MKSRFPVWSNSGGGSTGGASSGGLPTPTKWGSSNAANLLASNAQPLPLAWGVVKINNVLLAQLNQWNPLPLPYDAWQPGQIYYPGNRIQANGNVYEAALPYLPTTANALGGGAWTNAQNYSTGSIVFNGGNVYGAAIGGTSASSGPTGTATFADGSIIWLYLGTANPASRVGQQLSQPTQWLPYQSYDATYPLVVNGGNVYQSNGAVLGRSAASGAGPAGTGSAIADSTMTWRYMCQTSGRSGLQTLTWTGSTAYVLGNTVANGSNYYVCVVAGTSGASSIPTGTSAGIVDGGVTWNWYGIISGSIPKPTVWKASTAYTLSAYVLCGPSIYKCTTAGTSGTVGPFILAVNPPFGSGAIPADGSVVWSWVSVAGNAPSHTTGYASDGTLNWLFISANPASSSGGVYFPSFIAALAEGPVYGVTRLWWDKYQFIALGSRGLNFLAATNDGSAPYALNGIALIQNSRTAAYVRTCSDTNTSPPALAFEVQGAFAATAGDVNPADIISDLITSPNRGAGLPSSLVDTSITGGGATTFRTYCDAIGFRLSLLLDSQHNALDVIANLLLSTNSDATYSQGVIKAFPLGDTPITSPVFGATNYTPNVSPVASLGPDDFIVPPVLDADGPEDSFNSCPVAYTDRSSEYSQQTVEDPEMADVDVRGLWRASVTQLYATFPDATAPTMISRIMSQRQVYCRNRYSFTVAWNYVYLEPGDLVAITAPLLGLTAQLVRITGLQETPAGKISFTAEDYVIGVQHVTPHAPALATGTHTSFGSTLGNLPITIGLGSGLGITPGTLVGHSAFSGKNLPFQLKPGQYALDTVLGTADLAAGQVDQSRLSQGTANFANLWPNGTSEIAPPPSADVSQPEWSGIVSTAGYSGISSRRIAGASAKLQLVLPASAGESYTLEAYILANVAFTAFGGAVKIEALDYTMATLANSSTGSTPYGLQQYNDTASWLRCAALLQMPTGTCYVRFSLLNRSNAAADAFYDNIIASRSYRIIGEVPSGPTTSFNANDTYGLAFTPSPRDRTEVVYVGGIRRPRTEYVISTAPAIVFAAVSIPQGETVLVDYDS